MEPERKIEKLLRACAKKRRTDAGDPFKLHPATRRLLQGEVARRKAKPDDEETSVTLWELFRQRWAVLAGFVCVVFFVATLFLPALSSSKKKAQSMAAVSNLKEIGVAAQTVAEENYGKLPASLDALTNQLGSDKVTDPQTGKPFIYVAGGENLSGLSSNSVLAYSAADEKGKAVLFADGRVEVVNNARLYDLTNRELSQLVATDSARREQVRAPAELKDSTAASFGSALSKSETDRSDEKLAGFGGGAVTANTGTLAANARAASPPALGQRAKLPGAAANNFAGPNSSVQFATGAAKNFNSNLQNSFKNTIAPSKAATVLANFQVQQSGSAVRVVDADGSVYDGSLQPGSVPTQNEPAPATVFSRQTNQEKSTPGRDETQATQNYSFRVMGTNLTLKQNVVFAGNLQANSLAKVQQSLKSDSIANKVGGQLQSALTNQLPWANSRISGTAIVADTNNIEVDALPQTP